MKRWIFAFATTTLLTQVSLHACESRPIGCGQHVTASLEQSSCVFSDSPTRFSSFNVQLNAGTVVNLSITSQDFKPVIQIYGGTPYARLAVVRSIASTAELSYRIPRTGLYNIVASGLNAYAGKFTLDIYCAGEGSCTGAFAVNTLAGPLQGPRGGVVSMTESADGTPPIHYRWFDTSNPGLDLGDDGRDFITPALYKTTWFGVEVSNACGRYTDYVRVHVLPELARTRPARH